MRGKWTKWIVGSVLLAILCLVAGMKIAEMVYAPCHDTLLARRIASIEDLTTYIEEFYDDQEQVAHGMTFAEFVEQRNRTFSSATASPSLQSKYDFGVFCLLPTLLTSERPAMIMYTDPIAQGKDEGKRCAVFLEGKQMDVRVLSREEFRKELPSAETRRDVPDLCFSRRHS